MIEHATIDAIVSHVEACAKTNALDESMASQLRNDFPDYHFTWCMEDDIGCEEPLLECNGFNLYLVDGQGHCLKLTTDLTKANGVVIAEVTE